MHKYLLLVAALAALFLNACANDLEVEDTSNRGPAPYAADPMSNIPTNTNTNQGPGY